MIEINEAIPRGKAEMMYEMMRKAEFHHNDQKERRGEFTYTAAFNDSPLAKEYDFHEGFLMLKPKLEAHFGHITDATVMAYRMDMHDHFDAHKDSHLGRGFVLYLSPEWQWDWGGLLVVDEGNGARAYKPEFNKAVLMDSPQTYHCVTKIEPHAPPRYAMVGFIK